MLEVLLALALLVALALALLLLVLTKNWKAAFGQREWTLVPSRSATQIHAAIDRTVSELGAVREVAREALDETRATREEFSILGPELDRRAAEVKELRMGQEFQARRPLLLATIRALETIGTDRTAQSDPHQTLLGIEVDLQETLDDNRVERYWPAQGERIPVRGVEGAAMRYVASPDEALVGTIASVERPAYIAIGPAGTEEVLKSALVTVFASQKGTE